MTSKTSRTIFICLTMLLAVLVPLTASEWYNSLSAHADANNEIVYNAMHISAMLFFFINGFATKNNFDYVLGLGMAGILLTNMYDYPMIHNIFTAITIGGAIYEMIKNSGKGFRGSAIMGGVAAVAIFLIGYLSQEVYFLFAEVVVIFIIGMDKLRRIWGWGVKKLMV